MTIINVPLKEPIVIITQAAGVIDARLSPVWARWFAQVVEPTISEIEGGHESTWYFADATVGLRSDKKIKALEDIIYANETHKEPDFSEMKVQSYFNSLIMSL